MALKDSIKKYSKQLKWIWGLFFTGVLLVFLFFYAISEWELFGTLPSFDELENPKSNLAAEIYSSDRVLLGTFFKENRSNVEFKEIAPIVIQTLIATEDERFFEHAGIDPRALARAIKGMGKDGGGSTLTQQLAKLLFTEKPADNIVVRVIQKLKEWVIAVRLERHYTKEELVTMYLNKVDFINNAVGIKSASRIYFSKLPSELNMQQAAMFVGMCVNPSLYNPVRKTRADTVLYRRNVVMTQMVRSNIISQKQRDSLKVLPLGLKLSLASHKEGTATYFREELRRYMSDWCSRNINPSTGENYSLYRDGLKIYTTINSKMQTYAENAVKSHLGGELQDVFFKHWKNKNGVYKKMAPFYFEGVNEKQYKEQVDKIIVEGIRSSSRYNAELDQRLHIRKALAKYLKYKDPDNSYEARLKSMEENRYFYQSQLNSYKRDTANSPLGAEKAAAFKDSVDQLKERMEEVRNERKDIQEDVDRAWKAYQRVWKPFDDSIMRAFNKPIKTTIFTWKGDKDTIMSLRDSVHYAKWYLQTGMLSVDPQTGYIKAWVGGINYKHYQYDHVSQGRRQVGSTFKAFVYATAVENGWGPCDKVLNNPVTFPQGMYGIQSSWTPKNSEVSKLDGEVVTLKIALANSINNVSAFFMHEYGPEAIIDVARRCGITSPLDMLPSICLGTPDISLKEMVSAYSCFANKGVWVEPTYILRIEDKNGNVIFNSHPKTREALSEETAFKMVELLSGIAAYGPIIKGEKTYGTGIRLRSSAKPYGNIPYSIKIAGKTGTTQNQSDGWFMGITPDVVTGVWVGCDDRSAHFTSLRLGMGTNMALPIWGYYMNSLYKDKDLKISKDAIEKPASLGGVRFDCEEKNSDFNFNMDDIIEGGGGM